MRCSVLIATHKRNALLKWSLQSLSEKNNLEDVEVIVLDDSFEGDPQCEALCDKHGFKYVHSGATKESDMWRIPGYAFNIGARMAKGTCIALSCAEVYHVGSTLDAGLRAQEGRNVMAIPSGIADDKGAVIGTLERGDTPTAQIVNDHRQLNPRLPFFMVLPRSFFMGIGGYDEDFTGVCFDDDDISHRLKMAGLTFHSVGIPVVHLHHKRHNYRSPEIQKRWEHNKQLFESRKHDMMRNQGRDWGKL